VDKKWILSVPSHYEGFCLAWCLLAGKFLHENKRKRQKRLITNKNFWLEIKQLYRDSKILLGEEIDNSKAEKLSKTVSKKKFQIHFYSSQNKWRQYKKIGNLTKETRHIHILEHNEHAYLCTNMISLLGSNNFQFCEPCGIFEPRNFSHICPGEENNFCSLCRNKKCKNRLKKSKEEHWFKNYECHFCNKKFYTAYCCLAHDWKTRGQCFGKNKKKCFFCGIIDNLDCFENKEGKHKKEFCDKPYCKYCDKRRERNHMVCFVHPYKEKENKKQKNKILYFWDSEARVTEENGVHNFIYICLQKEDGEQQTFWGEDCVDQFMNYLFKTDDVDGRETQRIIIAHNFRSYDSLPILKWTYENALNPDLKFIGQSCYMLYFRAVNIMFKCSYNFITQPLAKFGQLFGLEESKGFFPFKFHTPETDEYVGKLPDKKHFGPENMKPEREKEFQEWYRKEKENVKCNWNLKETLKSYCNQDTKLLRLGCMEYAKISESITGMNPFKVALTCTSASALAFRKDHLKPNTIPMIHDHGIDPSTLTSREAEQWLAYLGNKYNIEIECSLTGKERKDGRYRFDGYVETEKEIKECSTKHNKKGSLKRYVFCYKGCSFHGCKYCKTTKQKNPYNHQPLWIQMELDERRKEYIERIGIRYVDIQACQWKEMVKESPEIKKFIEDKFGMIAQKLQPRKGFFGGRTNLVALWYIAKVNERIRHFDFCSLYPFVCCYRDYPIGEPKIMRHDLKKDIKLKEIFGICLVTVLPPRKLYMPVLPIKDKNGKLCFTLCYECCNIGESSPRYCRHTKMERSLKQQIYATPELLLALEYGYKIVEIHEIWHWEKKSDCLFKDYILRWMKLKYCASGLPDGREINEYLKEIKEQTGLIIRPEELQFNPAQRVLAKNHIVNFWGKMGMKINHKQHKILKKHGEIIKFLDDDTKIKKDVCHNFKNCALVSWSQDPSLAQPIPNLSLIVAIFTTCWARVHLYREVFAKLNPGQILYKDTDSIVYVEKEGEPKLKTENGKLGALTNEQPETHKITRYFSGGPKTWAYEVEDETGEKKWVSKSKGIKFTKQSLDDLPIEKMWNLVINLDTSTQKIHDYQKFRRDVTTGTVRQFHEEKLWKINITKRRIDHNKQFTIPFGYEGIDD
jgi:hypothetical protein